MKTPKPFQFISIEVPGATMNRYGIVFLAGGKTAEPGIRGMVQREAISLGYHLVADDDPDVGLVWNEPLTVENPS